MSDLGESRFESNPVEWPFPELRGDLARDPGGCLFMAAVDIAFILIGLLCVVVAFGGR